jgi:hypothetical protein
LLQSQKLFFSVTTGGQTGNVPLEKSFRLGGESIYDFMMNPYYRAVGTLPNSWWTNGHIYQDGGGHLRSLANDWQSSGNYWFSNYLSLTIGNPLHIGRTYIPYLSDMLFSVYTSWSSVDGSWGQFSQFYGEAGLSLAFERIPFVLNYFDVENIHLDFPFWVNNRIDPANTKFRWILRLDIRSFY